MKDRANIESLYVSVCKGPRRSSQCAAQIYLSNIGRAFSQSSLQLSHTVTLSLLWHHANSAFIFALRYLVVPDSNSDLSIPNDLHIILWLTTLRCGIPVAQSSSHSACNTLSVRKHTRFWEKHCKRICFCFHKQTETVGGSCPTFRLLNLFFLLLILLTYEIPLPVGYVGGDVNVHHLEVQQPAVVGPGAKLQVTLLHIEWEPPHIDVAGTLQDAWRKDKNMLRWKVLFHDSFCFSEREGSQHHIHVSRYKVFKT